MIKTESYSSPEAGYGTPEAVEKLRLTISELVADITDIQLQLSQRDQRHENGERLTKEEYWGWHARATEALRWKLREHSRAKTRLKSLNIQVHAAQSGVKDPHDTKHLLTKLFQLNKSWIVNMGIIPNKEEQHLLDLVRSTLNS